MGIKVKGLSLVPSPNSRLKGKNIGKCFALLLALNVTLKAVLPVFYSHKTAA